MFISGYTGHDVVERGLIERDWPFLPKPVAPDALARKVRELLDGRSAGSSDLIPRKRSDRGTFSQGFDDR
jgi:hypothetical protein